VRNIQIKRISNYSNLFKAIITYETHLVPRGKDDLEYQRKYIERLVKDRLEIDCQPCEMMERRRRSIDGWERE
jgi:hypothetical protein